MRGEQAKSAADFSDFSGQKKSTKCTIRITIGKGGNTLVLWPFVAMSHSHHAPFH